MARAMNRAGFSVTLATPNASKLSPADFRVSRHGFDERKTAPLLEDADVFVLQGFVLYQLPFLKTVPKPMVVDIYGPLMLENLENYFTFPSQDRHRLHDTTLAVLCEQLAVGDFFICASERQRDFWLGMLAALNRVSPKTYAQDRSLYRLVDIVPFGLASEPPQHTRKVLKGVYPGISAEDKVILWGSGIWDWFDPLTLIEAVGRVSRVRSDVKLFFMSKGHPNPELNSALRLAMYARAVQLSKDLGLYNRFVFFNQDWVPYAERANYLLEADIGASTHYDYVETLFSFRTRLLDYIWAELPMLVSAGDSMGEEVVRRYGLGEVVTCRDVEEMTQAILRLADTPNLRAHYHPRFAGIREQFRWERAVEPLARFCAKPHFAPDYPRGREVN
jgi:glycosyltransferase involved in cell wall biosynthesis